MTEFYHQGKWIKKYMKLASIIAKDNACCFSRKIGVVLVSKHNAVLSVGYNGPPVGIPHCNSEEFINFCKKILSKTEIEKFPIDSLVGEDKCTCIRQALGYASGERLEICPAVHAEQNAILWCAVNGVSTVDSIMFSWCGLPCKTCAGTIIQAKIKAIVTLPGDYDPLSHFLLEQSGIEIFQITKELQTEVAKSVGYAD